MYLIIEENAILVDIVSCFSLPLLLLTSIHVYVYGYTRTMHTRERAINSAYIKLQCSTNLYYSLAFYIFSQFEKSYMALKKTIQVIFDSRLTFSTNQFMWESNVHPDQTRIICSTPEHEETYLLSYCIFTASIIGSIRHSVWRNSSLEMWRLGMQDDTMCVCDSDLLNVPSLQTKCRCYTCYTHLLTSLAQTRLMVIVHISYC